MPMRGMITIQAVKNHQEVTGDNIEGEKGTSEAGS